MNDWTEREVLLKALTDIMKDPVTKKLFDNMAAVRSPDPAYVINEEPDLAERLAQCSYKS